QHSWSSSCAGCSSRSNSSLPCLAPYVSAFERLFSVSLPEREIECGQQCSGFVVGPRRGAHRDVHAPCFPHLVEVDFGENDVLLDAERIVATAVKTLRVEAAEIPHALQRNVDETIDEIV